MGMKKPRRTRKRRRPPDFALEVRFERQARRAAIAARPQLLETLRLWRHRPQRVYWVIDATGGWRRL
jgi:hypothetical protein